MELCTECGKKQVWRGGDLIFTYLKDQSSVTKCKRCFIESLWGGKTYKKRWAEMSDEDADIEVEKWILMAEQEKLEYKRNRMPFWKRIPLIILFTTISYIIWNLIF